MFPSATMHAQFAIRSISFLQFGSCQVAYHHRHLARERPLIRSSMAPSSSDQSGSAAPIVISSG